MGTLIDGVKIAAALSKTLGREREALGQLPVNLRILSFDSPASRVYRNAQVRAASSLRIETGATTPIRADSDLIRAGRESVECALDVDRSTVARVIQGWNDDPAVHGIFVHQPLPPQLDAQWITTLIDPRKDVEGIHPQNSARRFFAKARIGSCTALAVMELIDWTLEQSGETLEGKEAVVVGHSEIVGRPVSMLLLDRLATTTVCHIGTDRAGRLEDHVRRADVLVVAVGRPQLIKGSWIKPGATVIDVGISVVEKRVVGDVDFEGARERAAFISPVPGGVGPVTVMMVMKNTLEAFRQQRGGAHA